MLKWYIPQNKENSCNVLILLLNKIALSFCLRSIYYEGNRVINVVMAKAKSFLWRRVREFVNKAESTLITKIQLKDNLRLISKTQ